MLSVGRRNFLLGWSALCLAVKSGAAFAQAKVGAGSAAAAGSEAPKLKGTFVEGHMVPSPRRISAQAQAYLQAATDADGRRKRVELPYPAASDHAGWAALKQQSNAGIDASFAADEARLKSTGKYIDLGGVKVFHATPAGGSQRKDCAFLDVHGGALVYGEGGFCRFSTRKHADNLGVEVYGVEYRTPPEFPYPAALDDCVTAYRALLKRYPAEKIMIGGLSAGGNLAAATILRARDEGLPLPRAAVLQSPELDLTESGDSFSSLDGLDLIYPASLMPINLLYANGHDLTDPYVSPLFGDFTKGYPPTFLQAGTRDFFLSNAILMHRALRRAGIKAELHVFEAMPHGGFRGTPEDADLEAEIARYVKENWPA